MQKDLVMLCMQNNINLRLVIEDINLGLVESNKHPDIY